MKERSLNTPELTKKKELKLPVREVRKQKVLKLCEDLRSFTPNEIIWGSVGIIALSGTTPPPN